MTLVRTQHPLYWRWGGMLARCENPNHAGYPKYGGRGIKVCERWHDFALFLEDMGMPESLSMTLDRKENDGDYCKENCRWATRAEQSRNTSRNVRVTIEGLTLTVRDWELRKGVTKGTFQRRVDLGWPLHDAVSLPVQPGKALERRACH